MQYRMCQGIMELSNALIYGDRLCCGSSEIASAKLSLSSLKSCSSWLREVKAFFPLFHIVPL
jgi:DNA replication ATP-dependent helicase Dna2